MSKPDLIAIKKRANAATMGPWEYDEEYGDISGGRYTVVDSEHSGWNQERTKANLKFIAASRTDIPALLAYCKKLEAALSQIAQHPSAQDEPGEANKRRGAWEMGQIAFKALSTLEEG